MIKTVIKLVIVVVIANATWRVGSAYAQHYRFVDAVEQVAQFSANKPDTEIHEAVFKLASQHVIPVTDENLTITNLGQHLVIKGSYTRSLELFPGFKYAWPFSVHVDVISNFGASPPVHR